MSTISARGVFITFEGPDGSGKSTQARMLAERLRGQGRPVLESPWNLAARRSANRSGGFCSIRQIKELTATAELLLMFAARAQNVEQWILPALHAGQDRHLGSLHGFFDRLSRLRPGSGLGEGVRTRSDRVPWPGPGFDDLHRHRYRNGIGARAGARGPGNTPRGTGHRVPSAVRARPITNWLAASRSVFV